NTAIALGRLGVPVAFLGTLSHDEYGGLLAGRLLEAGVVMSLVRRSDAPTPLAVVHRHDDGGNSYTFDLTGTALADLPPEAVPALPEHVWAIHVGTLGLAVDPPAAAYEALVDREAGRRTIVLNPNVRPAVFGDQASYRARFERFAKLADSVGAALLAALVERKALEPGATRSLDDSLLEESVEYAVTASAITCTRMGAVPPSRAELDAWIGTSQEV